MRARGASYQVHIDGRPLTDLAAWGDLETVHEWPGDCSEASWTMTTRYKAHNPVFHRDARVEVRLAGVPVFGGLFQEPQWNGRDAQVTARGLYRAAEDYPAFTSAALATDNPAVAITAQITRGLPWTLDASVPNASMLGTTPDRGNMLVDLLNAYAEQQGLEWGVDARGRVYFAPSTSWVTTWGTAGVDYHIVVGVGELSAADDSYASHIDLWYLNQSDVYKAVVWPPYSSSGPTGNAYERTHGHRDWIRDITDLGNIDDADALALATEIYNRGLLRPSFNEGLEVAYGELVTRGGVPATLSRVRVNKVCRVHGVTDPVIHTPYTDFVIGKVTRSQGAKTITLQPVGAAAVTEDDILQELTTTVGSIA